MSLSTQPKVKLSVKVAVIKYVPVCKHRLWKILSERVTRSYTVTVYLFVCEQRRKSQCVWGGESGGRGMINTEGGIVHAFVHVSAWAVSLILRGHGEWRMTVEHNRRRACCANYNFQPSFFLQLGKIKLRKKR